MKICLASGSPRRRELLEQIGVEFDIIVAKGEEVMTSSEPAFVVEELSRQKAEEVYNLLKSGEEQQDLLVIGADTVVAAGGEILGKPSDEKNAFDMIKGFQGKDHSVFTGVTAFYHSREKDGVITFHRETKVKVAAMSDDDINAYIATGEPMDKAGAYGIQGEFAKYVLGIDGDYNNVVGLPVAALYQELKTIGIDICLK